MNVPVKGNEQVTKLFNDWYQAMLQQQISKKKLMRVLIE